VLQAHYESDPSIGAKGAFHLVKNLKVSRTTVYRLWKKLENGENIDCKPALKRKCEKCQRTK